MKLTTAQNALLHVAESLGISLGLGLVGGTYQYILGHGLNIPALLTFILPIFVGQLTMLYKSILANPNLGQAELDTLNEALQGLHDKFDNLLPFLHSHPVAAPTPAPAPVVNLPPSVSVPSVPQLPFTVTSGTPFGAGTLTGVGATMPTAINTTLGSMPAAPKQ